jgi:hypothetical protein
LKPGNHFIGSKVETGAFNLWVRFGAFNPWVRLITLSIYGSTAPPWVQKVPQKNLGLLTRSPRANDARAAWPLAQRHKYVAFVKSKVLKPGFHVIVSRVETAAFKLWVNCIRLVQPSLGVPPVKGVEVLARQQPKVPRCSGTSRFEKKTKFENHEITL